MECILYYNIFAHTIENNVDFIIRAKHLNVQRFPGLDSLPDKLNPTVELILSRTQAKRSTVLLHLKKYRI